MDGVAGLRGEEKDVRVVHTSSRGDSRKRGEGISRSLCRVKWENWP